MNNELLIEKPWWKRNILWLITAIVIISLITISSSLFINGNIDFYLLANADPSFYEIAIDSANKDKNVLEKFGKLNPIQNGEISAGKALYSKNKDSLNLILPVKGFKGNGTLDLWLHRTPKCWQYDSINVKNNSVKVSVIR